MAPSTDVVLARLLEGVERGLPRAVELRRRLHAQPELAHAEKLTAAMIAAELPVAGETAAGTGLLARVGPAEVAPVAVRAELDGLPIRERTGAPFSASGETMHACGHDVHMARAGGADARGRTRSRVSCRLRCLAVFQPSEETYPSRRGGAGRAARSRT
jgi:metal-dependent amidase/aminoacylase/carboxypeptidase family protein